MSSATVADTSTGTAATVVDSAATVVDSSGDDTPGARQRARSGDSSDLLYGSLNTPRPKRTYASHIIPALTLTPTASHAGVKERRGRTPARTARAAALISPIYSPRVPKAFTSARQLKYENRVRFDELYVKRSQATPHKCFTEKNLTLGWGLFLPHDRAGMCPGLYVCLACVHALECMSVCLCVGFTEELAFEGPHVLHVSAQAMRSWQREYAIQDTFTDGMVFVPNTPSCVCKLFRVQHDEDDPTHELSQIDANKCVLVPLRKIKKGGELTFDYFGSEDDMVSSTTGLAGRQVIQSNI